MTDQDQLILGIDTSTQVQVGIAAADRVLVSRTFDDPRSHVEQLAPLVRDAISEGGVDLDQLTKIIFGVGPGPYTGLRVGIATARTLGQALGIPVRGVCSLDVLAAQWLESATPPAGEFMIITDARRQEVYWATYDHSGQRLSGPGVDRPSELPVLPVAGPGSERYPELNTVPDAPLRLDAGVLAKIGDHLDVAGIEPLYLRSPDAAPPGPRKPVLPKVLP